MYVFLSFQMTREIGDKMKNKNKINQFILEWIYQDLNDCYWDELWESIKKGSIRVSLTLDHELVDEMDYDYEKVWKDFWKDEHPFFNDLDKVMDKWRRELG